MTTPVETLLKATDALEPGDLKEGDFVRAPAAETEKAPEKPGMIVSGVVSAGYSILYDTISREPSTVNNNMVAAQLRVRRPDGSPVFTRMQPVAGPWRGTIICFLHKEHPDRAKHDAMGFPVCRKQTLPNLFQAENHARNRHRDEWRAVEAEREAIERREDRAAQTALLNAVAGDRAVVAPVVSPTTTAASPTITQPGTEVTTNTGVEVPEHKHNYYKKMGSPCKTEGCPEVRTKPFTKRGADTS